MVKILQSKPIENKICFQKLRLQHLKHFFLFCFRHGLRLAMYIIGGLLVAGTLANIHAWARALGSLFVSQSRHLKKALKNNEGAPLTALGTEVSLMTDMVKVVYIYFPRRMQFT